MTWEGKLHSSGSKKKKKESIVDSFMKINICFTNCGEFLEWLNYCLYFKNNIAPWRFFFAYWVLSSYWSNYKHSKTYQI